MTKLTKEEKNYQRARAHFAMAPMGSPDYKKAKIFLDNYSSPKSKAVPEVQPPIIESSKKNPEDRPKQAAEKKPRLMDPLGRTVTVDVPQLQVETVAPSAGSVGIMNHVKVSDNEDRDRALLSSKTPTQQPKRGNGGHQQKTAIRHSLPSESDGNEDDDDENKIVEPLSVKKRKVSEMEKTKQEPSLIQMATATAAAQRNNDYLSSDDDETTLGDPHGVTIHLTSPSKNRDGKATISFGVSGPQPGDGRSSARSRRQSTPHPSKAKRTPQGMRSPPISIGLLNSKSESQEFSNNVVENNKAIVINESYIPWMIGIGAAFGLAFVAMLIALILRK